MFETRVRDHQCALLLYNNVLGTRYVNDDGAMEIDSWLSLL